MVGAAGISSAGMSAAGGATADDVPMAMWNVLMADPDTDAAAAALEALREEGLIGVVFADPDLAAGAMASGAIATDGADIALTASPAGVQPGLHLHTVAARLQRRLGAAVQFWLSEDSEPFESVPPDMDAAALVEERRARSMEASLRSVVVVPVAADVVAPRLPELSLTSGGSLTVVPADARSIVVLDGAGLPMLPRNMRPAVGLLQQPGRVVLRVWLREPIERPTALVGRIADRVARPAFADWEVVWDTRPVGIVPPTAAEAGLGEDAHTAAIALQTSMLALNDIEVQPPVVDALALSPTAIAELRRVLAGDEPRVAELCAALDLPSATAALTDAGVDPAAIEGSTSYQARGMRGAFADAVFAEPTGDGLAARNERWWSRHPRLALSAAIVMIVLALGLGASALLQADSPWYRLPLAGLVGLNGALLLWSALRRRRRR